MEETEKMQFSQITVLDSGQAKGKGGGKRNRKGGRKGQVITEINL